MEIAKNQATKASPYDAEVEWIQNHSAQPASQYPDRYAGVEYVDLGIPLPAEFKFDVKLKLMTSYGYVTRCQIFGSNQASGAGFSIGNNWGLVRVNCGSQSIDTSLSMAGDFPSIRIFGTVKNTEQQINCDSNGRITSDTFNLLYMPSTSNAFLFSNNGNVPGGAQNIVQMQFMYLKITSLDEEQAYIDVIPVRKDGAGYAYDRTSGKLLGSVVSGSFITGPDAKGAL